MIPVNELLKVKIKEQPSLTYGLNVEKGVIQGKVDGQQAMEQAIYKILSTERFRHEIYSWNYGVELQHLIGEPTAYLYPELKRYIREALLQDDRIKKVDDFRIKMVKDEVLLSFIVQTLYGDLSIEKVVRR